MPTIRSCKGCALGAKTMIRSNDCIGDDVALDRYLRDELQAMMERRGQAVALDTPAVAPTEISMAVIARQAWTQIAGLCMGSPSAAAAS